MRMIKNFKELYLKNIIILILPIMLLYSILKNFPSTKNILNKTTILSTSIENPSLPLTQIKNRFSDLWLTKKIEYANDSGDENLTSNIEIVAENNIENERENENSKDSEEEFLEFVPEEFRGPIIEETFKGGDLPLYVNLNPGYISNRTKINSYTLIEKINKMPSIAMPSSNQPQVLLFSTHATEAFEPCDRKFFDKRYNSRTTDNDKNVTKIEEKIAEQLNNNGISTIVDKTQHDFPSYNGSYNRSAKTINNYLQQYPSIKVVLDIHRDAIERSNGERVKPVITINEKKCAQIMIISGCDDGTMNFPNWEQNLNFATDLQRCLESEYPGVTRPIFFCYRKYNMNILPCSLLIEFGSNSNSLSEVLYAGELMGNALSHLLLQYKN